MEMNDLSQIELAEIKEYLSLCSIHLRCLFQQRQLDRPLTEAEILEARQYVSTTLSEAREHVREMLLSEPVDPHEKPEPF